MRRRIGLCYLTLFDCGLLDRIRIAGAAGYDEVGLRLTPASPDDRLEPLLTDASLRRRVVEELNGAGVSAGDTEFVKLSPAMDLAALEPLFACAAELGVRHLVVLATDGDLPSLTDRFGALCEAAGAYGLRPQLEFALWSPVSSLAATRAVVEGSGRPEGGVLLDAFHVDRAGVSLDEIRATPPERIRSLQLCDAPRAYDRELEPMKAMARRGRLPPGQGELDLIELVRATPAHAVIGAEVPNDALQARLGAEQYARFVMEQTQRVLQLAEPDG